MFGKDLTHRKFYSKYDKHNDINYLGADDISSSSKFHDSKNEHITQGDIIKIILMIVFAIVVILIGLSFELTESMWSDILYYCQNYKYFGLLSLILIYIICTVTLLPLKSLLSVLAGYLYGFFMGCIAIWIAAVIGCGIAFYVARCGCYDIVHRLWNTILYYFKKYIIHQTKQLCNIKNSHNKIYNNNNNNNNNNEKSNTIVISEMENDRNKNNTTKMNELLLELDYMVIERPFWTVIMIRLMPIPMSFATYILSNMTINFDHFIRGTMIVRLFALSPTLNVYVGSLAKDFHSIMNNELSIHSVNAWLTIGCATCFLFIGLFIGWTLRKKAKLWIKQQRQDMNIECDEIGHNNDSIGDTTNSQEINEMEETCGQESIGSNHSQNDLISHIRQTVDHYDL